MAAVMGLEHSPFRNIPVEVLLSITSTLPTTDLCSFRLTSRIIADLLDESFVREFFSRKQFMFSEFSLRALIDISKSRLGRHITRLQFGTDRLPPIPLQVISHASVMSDVGAQEDALHRCKKAVADEFWFLESGVVQDYVAEALCQLPNLEDIVIRDFDSPRRTRDGMQWSSYGSRTIRDITPELKSLVREGSMERMFVTVLSALAKNGDRSHGANPKFRGLETLSHGYDICLTETAFHVPKFLEPSLDPVIARLEKLHLALNGPHANHVLQTHNGNVSQLVLFLRRAKSLKDLRINAYGGTRYHSTAFVMDRIFVAGPRLLELMINDDELELPMLETLSLGFFIVPADVLLAALRRFSGTLKSLSLWRIRLCRALPDDALQPDFELRQKFWTAFLSTLRETDFERLHHIQIGHMQQLWLAHHPHDSMHRACVEAPIQVGPKMLEYRGIDWKHYILDNIDSLEYKWPTGYVTAEVLHSGEGDLSMSEDEDDEDDDDDDDDDENDSDHETLM